MRRAAILTLAIVVLVFGAWSAEHQRSKPSTASADVPPATDTVPEALAFVERPTAPFMSASDTTAADSTTSSTSTPPEPVVPPQVLAGREESLAGRFHVIEADRNEPDARRPVRLAPHVEAPVVERLSAGDVVLLGGAVAVDGGGGRWVNVVDERWAEIGWLRRNTVGTKAGIVVRNGDGTEVATSHPGGWTSGVEILPPVVVAVGCDAVQVEVTSATHHGDFSSHLRYGTVEPHAPRASWEDPQWDMGAQSGIAFIRPRGRLRITLPAPEPTTYYFLALDEQNDAASAFDFNGNAILNDDGELTAAGTQSITVSGVCWTPER